MTPWLVCFCACSTHCLAAEQERAAAAARGGSEETALLELRCARSLSHTKCNSLLLHAWTRPVTILFWQFIARWLKLLVEEDDRAAAAAAVAEKEQRQQSCGAHKCLDSFGR